MTSTRHSPRRFCDLARPNLCPRKRHRRIRRVAALQKIKPRWRGKPSVVAASGPSLTPDVAEVVARSGWPVLVCQDAYRRLPWAEILYGCDERWWDVHEGTDFKGEKWSTHGDAQNNDKRAVAEKYGVNLIQGRSANDQGFSTDLSVIHYGDCSGYQALNLAILLGSPYIVLVGYDMGGAGHFFGEHPSPLHNQDDYAKWVPHFRRSAVDCPAQIINATPGSAIDCWPVMTLEEAIENYRLHRDRAVANA